ncbi:RBPJ-interacting and tubulin-associated protein 1 [Dasypus novemcinctus]|uniref:RBPJ-interacting and tubulin-associated protein 1 n=1 Tax=Dasypus novemcinctus TaxID=9361 RepID=UPI0000E361D8|nr:RBPJ-interacting and tubulin-associated protein 1 [Dasypus novemcinctus]XP_004456209.1 RBPJ-interacting and tubulin-associated protein 1 [Dasypus novemcinctus]XP_004456210.1 RBPJ-interacting and tubulin-associated protein 1 [Dasypus novemcinctus]XP_004456212.1 RBPJ-interacting and tubulin-associated protein 1 [Dasypus novemcinctus]XP_058137374.1 RBPJ-interacting and tubulin-associated protein 1 [Dasypus novemcinctus]
MRTAVELAVSGMQTLHLQHRCRVKARASYVDETLFGSPAGTRPTPPDFDPPWVEKASRSRGAGTGALQASGANRSCEITSTRGSAPTFTPRKKNKYRLIRHTPSYCDESLFGSRPEGASWEASWTAKGEAAKLRALFWTPPATPRGSNSPRPRETRLRAIHPAGASKTEPGVAADSGPLSSDGLGSPRPCRRGRSHSLTHLNVPGPGRPPTSAPDANGPREPRPPPLGVSFRSPLVTPRARSVSVSVPTTPRRGGTSQKPKPPWK